MQSLDNGEVIDSIEIQKQIDQFTKSLEALHALDTPTNSTELVTEELVTEEIPTEEAAPQLTGNLE